MEILNGNGFQKISSELPDRILREISEILDNDESLFRNKVIGEILTNEYNYILEKEYDDRGIRYWLYRKDSITSSNKDLDESYLINELPVWEDHNRWVMKNLAPLISEFLIKRKKKVK